MANFPLHRNKTIKTLLTPSRCTHSDEYADRICDLHLRDELHKNQDGKLIKYYRLRANKPHSVEDALAYDIHCPSCRDGMLKQVTRCNNSTELGLYTCHTCNNHKLRGGKRYE